MRIPLLICWLAACLPLAAGTLKFEKTTKQVEVTDEQTTATVDFPFKNESDRDVVIAKQESDCPCAAVGVKDSKTTYKPGESGTIRIVFDLGKVPETVDKFVSIYLKGDPEDHPSIKLTSHIKVPVLVEVEPKSVIWEVGGKPVPKTVTVTMKHTEPIKVISMSCTDSRFKQELKTIEEGKKYEVVITPDSTEKIGMGVLQLATDAKFDRHRSQRVFTIVRSPLPNPGQAASTEK